MCVLNQIPAEPVRPAGDGRPSERQLEDVLS